MRTCLGISVWILSCAFFGAGALATDISLSGKCVLTSYDLSTGSPRKPYPYSFSFSRKDGDWKLEVQNHPLFPGLRKIQWVHLSGVMYRTEFAASPATNVIPRVMAITTNNLPDFGWHCAVSLLLVLAPDVVLAKNPPSIPRAAFLPDDPNQPARMWCQYDSEAPDKKITNLRAYGERSASAPTSDSPRAPTDPLLLFESKISRFLTVHGNSIPVQFHFRACYPRGTASPEDVRASWDVKGEVKESEIAKTVGSLLEVEGRTLVADYRVPSAMFSYTSYITTNLPLSTNSSEFKNLGAINAQASHAGRRNRLGLLLPCFAGASFLLVLIIYRIQQTKHTSNI